jgi:hypothetical protein
MADNGQEQNIDREIGVTGLEHDDWLEEFRSIDKTLRSEEAARARAIAATGVDTNLEAFSRVFSHGPLGQFVKPKDNNWQRHKLAVLSSGLEFNPSQSSFDEILALHADRPAYFDPNHRDYEKYEGLRTNIAVVRNFLLNHFFPDGTVDDDKKDIQNVKHIQWIAGELGDMLARGSSLFHNYAKPSVNPLKANEEGVGAAMMYDKLRGMEILEGLLAPVYVPLNLIRGTMNRHWNLPDIEATPFHEHNLTAPFIPDTTSSSLMAAGNMAGSPQQQEALFQLQGVASGSFSELGESMLHASSGYVSVEELQQPVKIRAIELAQDILDKLRIRFGDTSIEAMLDHTDLPSMHDLLSDVNQLARVYYDHLQRGVILDPSLAENNDVLLASEALGKFAYQSKMQALKAAEQQGDTVAAEQIFADLEVMPDEWRYPPERSVGQLLADIKLGIDAVVNSILSPAHTPLTNEALERDYLQEIEGGSIVIPDANNQRERRNRQMFYADQYFDRVAEKKADQREAYKRTMEHSKQADIQQEIMRAYQGKKHHDAVVAQSRQGMDDLVLPDELMKMRDTLATPVTGEALNPGTKDAARRVLDQKGNRKLNSKLAHLDRQGDMQQDIRELRADRIERNRNGNGRG